MLMKRPLITIVKSLALLRVAGVCVGVAWEQYERFQDRKRLPQIGRSVDIGGRALNIYCSGTGTPAVIFESGGAGPGLAWTSIQTAVSAFTTACWYDRAGEGWSDPGPFPRTSVAIARDLHELLKRAGVPPPYVLAGASFGGLNSRVYSALYSNEVAGLVLIDSAHEDEPRRAPRFYLARVAPKFLWHPLCTAFQVAARIGLLRMMHESSSAAKPDTLQALQRQPKSIANNVATGMVMPESYAQAEAVKDRGDRPLIVLTAGQPQHFNDPELAKQAAAYQQVWIHEIQPKLARLSTRGRQVVVDNSDYGIGERAPDVVIEAIREVVAEARRDPAKR